MTDNDVAALFFILVFGGGIAWPIISRVLTHQERLAMIRRGMTPPPDRRSMRDARREAPWSEPIDWQAATSADEQRLLRRQLHRGIQLTFIGLALTIGLSFIGYHSGEGLFGMPSITPGPWLIGGLVPLFVGLSKVVIAWISLPHARAAEQEAASMPPPPPGTGRYGPGSEGPPPWERRVRQILDPEREIPPPGQPPARP
ncbi:MAG TPA: hypothetical protein VNJ51_11130 [Candidatus Dormibacteraeota bacterium]|nr:hypothetical protein [Candidatus Dormibacteraeota bacterium]